MAEEQQPMFAVKRIYVKDISFEAPGAPGIFLQDYKPKMNVQLQHAARKLSDTGDYEVEITVTLTAEQDEKTVYLAEVKQAGIFTIAGMPDGEVENLLGAYCPSVLYPYAREAIASLVVKGSFPVFQMQPINFDALHQQAKAQRAKEQAEGAPH